MGRLEVCESVVLEVLIGCLPPSPNKKVFRVSSWAERRDTFRRSCRTTREGGEQEGEQAEEQAEEQKG